MATITVRNVANNQITMLKALTKANQRSLSGTERFLDGLFADTRYLPDTGIREI